MRKRLGGRYLEIQGRDPKKSGKLIVVLCCFCGWIDFGVLCQLWISVEKKNHFGIIMNRSVDFVI